MHNQQSANAVIAPETKAMGILARWYAHPLSHDEARRLLELSVKREQEKLKRYATPYLSPYLRLIALHWLGESTDVQYQHLTSKLSRSAHAEILKSLIYGQLLMSRKQCGAMDYLDEAFHQARLLLRSDDYFAVMKRHHILKGIPLSDRAAREETLDGLLKTASVIARMKESQGIRPDFTYDPNDTYG